MRLEFSPLAESDLEAIGDYIAMDSPANAVRFNDGLQDQCEKIARAPMGYVVRPELAVDLRSARDIRAELVPDGGTPEN